MITLTNAVSVLGETNANSTLSRAAIDVLNRRVVLHYVYGNYTNGAFVPSPTLPETEVRITTDGGAVYVQRPNQGAVFVGWLQSAALTAVQTFVNSFVRGGEGLATGTTLTLPSATGGQSTNTQQLALFKGTVS